MDAFGDNFSSDDPAADFLNREREVLGGTLENEILGEISAPKAVDFDENTGLESSGSFEMINNDAQDYRKDEDFSQEPKPVYEVSEKIRKWREEQQYRLEEKDREEEKAKQELREKAKQELEDWYKKHEIGISKTKAANRSAERDLVVTEPAPVEGTEWERISKLCDFTQSSQAKNKCTKDNSRMKSIILQLKQTPLPSAAASTMKI